MDNRTDEKSMQELVEQMAAVQRRSQTLSMVITVVIAVMAAALIVSLAVVVPKITATLDHARTTLTDTQAVIQRISSSLDNLDSIGENLNGLSG
jgi:type II secretory pathway component PulF